MQTTLEKLVLPVLTGLILWLITNRLLQPVPAPLQPPETAAISSSDLLPAARPQAPSPPRREGLPLRAEKDDPLDNRPLQPSAITPLAAVPPSPDSLPLGTILLEDNLAKYREGEATPWGPGALVTLGQDKHPWLVSHVDGTYPIGRNILLPNQFSFECRYFGIIPEVTRGIFGWWKQPMTSRISFVDSEGVKHTIDWQIGCEQDTTRHDPPGSPLFAKKYYHVIKLPNGITNEVSILQPTGLLRINRNNETITVLIDGKVVAAGPVGRMANLVRFEIGLVKTSNGTLSFTDFKIAR